MRRPRVKNSGEGWYHLVSRCCLREFLFGDEDKEMLVRMLRRVERFSGVEVLSYAMMDNHLHVLVHVPRPAEVDEDELLERVSALYGQAKADALRERWEMYRHSKYWRRVAEEQDALRKRMGDITPFMSTLKQRFSTWYRAHHGCEGTIWQGRFGSTVVEGSPNALAAVAAYIDLNPVRAGVVKDPKDYRWSGYGAALAGDAQAMRGLSRVYCENPAPGDFTAKYAPQYRQLLYLKGSDVFDGEEVKKVVREHGKLPLPVLLRCKVGHFTRGVAFGSRAFVDAVFESHRGHFGAKRRTGARAVGWCLDWGGEPLCAARDLRKSPVSISA